MKRIISTVLMFAIIFDVWAQAPEKFSYQAIVRNASGALLANQTVGVRVSLIQGSVQGTAVFVETHTPVSNVNGLVTLEIGEGANVSGSFSKINWSKGPYYIKIETDPTGGTNYSIVGTSQLLSVPFSLFAESANLKFSTTGDTLFSGNQYVIVPGLSTANVPGQGSGQPTLTTSPATNITDAQAEIGGTISSQGASPVTTRGICYALTASPTTSSFTVSAGSGTGSFQVNLTGLNAGTTYYARAFAINASGTSYGNQVMFTTSSGGTTNCTGTIKDIDGNEYTIVAIGSQCWMKENLKVTKFRNGADIPIDNSGGTSGDAADQTWGWLTTPARTIYNHDAANLTTYGYLYNRYAASDSRGVCPVGWHIPTPSDWSTLALNLGGELVAGGKMKTTSNLWTLPNEGADNSSGFSANPGGRRSYISGKFGSKGDIAFYWSTGGSGEDFGRELHYDSRVLLIPSIEYTYHERNGLSIRCIRD